MKGKREPGKREPGTGNGEPGTATSDGAAVIPSGAPQARGCPRSGQTRNRSRPDRGPSTGTTAIPHLPVCDRHAASLARNDIERISRLSRITRLRRSSDATVPNVNGGVDASAQSQQFRVRCIDVRAARRIARPFSFDRDVFSSVVSRLMQLRVTARLIHECQKDFARDEPVENAIQNSCNLSHAHSSCTVAWSANRVILVPHFSPSVLPSRALQLPATTPRRRSFSQ